MELRGENLSFGVRKVSVGQPWTLLRALGDLEMKNGFQKIKVANCSESSTTLIGIVVMRLVAEISQDYQSRPDSDFYGKSRDVRK
jgi:hypothetical protein